MGRVASKMTTKTRSRRKTNGTVWREIERENKQRSAKTRDKGTEPSISSTLCYCCWAVLPLLLEHRPSTLHIFQSRDDVIDGRQPFKDRDEWKELRIMNIIEPTGHGNLDNQERDLMSSADSNTYSVILMEYVGDGRIVDDNHFANITTQPTEIFDVIPWKIEWKLSTGYACLSLVTVVISAWFTEESRIEDVLRIEQVRDRICILEMRFNVNHSRTKSDINDRYFSQTSSE